MSNPTPSGGPVTYHVTGQIEGTGRNNAGAFIPGVTVTFAMSNGHGGTVFIPQDRYDAANVKAAIEARVAQIRDVGNITGSVG